jgi:hypothetical protein
MHTISQISLRACSIDIPRISSHQFLKSRNVKIEQEVELLEFLIGFDTIQASLPNHPHPPPRFNPPNSKRHVTAALAVKARLDPNRSID